MQITRARRHCALICDSETVSSDPFLKGLIDYFEAHGDYVSAAELVKWTRTQSILFPSASVLQLTKGKKKKRKTTQAVKTTPHIN